MTTILFGLTCFAVVSCGRTAGTDSETASAAAMTTGDSPSVRGKNRLAGETSPYLLMHAENPVDWYPWGEAAFAKARKENKPIFLSIGYSTCYWCHVMERESFGDPDIARLMNETVVAVKVDREERPDVDDIYMSAVQLMTRRGGWPMSVFLTPDLKPFFGGTYIPREPFRGLLGQIREAWSTRRVDIEASADQVVAAMKQIGDQSTATAGPLPPATLLHTLAEQSAAQFDPQYGGFGSAPKFPQPVQLEALLTDHERRDGQKGSDRKSLEMVAYTLDAMARGGIYDQIGGGFHRYSTDARWRVPHFEKMLYDNAQLLHTYARAYRLTGNEEFRRVAEDIVSYVKRDMTAADGLFHSAQDSEVEGEEGRSYVWTREQIQASLSAEAFELADRVYGLGAEPDFDGRHVLHWPNGYADTARALKLEPDRLFARLQPVRAKLLAARRKRPQPLTDDKILTSWNGLMIEALAYAAQALKRPDYNDMAKRAASALLRVHRDGSGRLLRVSRHGKAKLAAYLEDYAALTLALLELHRSTGEAQWRAEASATADAMIEQLWDPAKGGFHQALAETEHLLVRRKESYDGALPSGNGLAARALTELAGQGSARYAAYATGTLRAFASIMEEHPQAVPLMVQTLSDYRASELPADLPLPRTASTLPSTGKLVSVSIALDQGASGGERQLRVRLRIDQGWHINANPASLDFLIPTTVTATVDQHTVDIVPSYPEGERLDTALGEVRIYRGEVEIRTPLPATQLPDGGRMTVAVHAQACDEGGTCLAPETLHTDLGTP